ncbi:MerR family transcriptional regulator [Streptomyces sp. NPDC008222]|uniref:MerR family transcriptional regulator n=1 Tax=Streptomyces sp. NPDC008222 TaxID=3364820 RepID=UPI0036E9B0A3
MRGSPSSAPSTRRSRRSCDPCGPWCDLHHAEFTRHALTVAERGIGAALAQLVPGTRLHEGGWELKAPGERDITLRGHGVVLMPTFHWTGHPLISHRPDSPLFLTYSAGPGLPLPPTGAGGTDDALAGVLGRTRHDILLLLAEEHSTSASDSRQRGRGMGNRLRVSDLARAAGISVQQVRSYVETGVLPPVERTPSGYRVFTDVHAEALATARQLAVGHGWGTTRLVLSAVHTADLETALAALDASHALLHRERGELAAVRDALKSVVTDHTIHPGTGHRRLRIGQVARAVGVKPPVLRLWESRGLLRPEREPSTGYRLYPRSEQIAAHIVALLRRAHHPLDTIDAVLEELRTSGSPDRVLEELTHRERDLYRRSLHRLQASAALHAYLRYLGLAHDAP